MARAETDLVYEWTIVQALVRQKWAITHGAIKGNKEKKRETRSLRTREHYSQCSLKILRTKKKNNLTSTTTTPRRTTRAAAAATTTMTATIFFIIKNNNNNDKDFKNNLNLCEITHIDCEARGYRNKERSELNSVAGSSPISRPALLCTRFFFLFYAKSRINSITMYVLLQLIPDFLWLYKDNGS